MRLAEKYCCEHKLLGYWSALGGVEVYYVDDETCICVSNAWYGKKSYHAIKIRYNSRGAYIVLHGTRLYFDECIGG